MIESEILNVAKNYNIIINLEKIRTTPNTRKIHSAISLIKKHNFNKSFDFAFKIMTDYFTNGIDIRNETYLKKLSQNLILITSVWLLTRLIITKTKNLF